MKYIILLTATLLSFQSCKNSQLVKNVSLSGTILNASKNEIVLKNNFWEAIDTIPTKNGNFNVLIDIPSGYYFVVIDDLELQLFLQEGNDIMIQLDLKDITNSISFSGDGGHENRYLWQKTRHRVFFDYINLDEPSFLKQTDSLNSILLDNLKRTKYLSTEFRALEESSINIDNAIRISQFQGRKRGVLQDPTYEVSDSYPNPYKDIDLNDAQLLKTYDYSRLLGNYVNESILKDENYSDTIDFFVFYQQYLTKADLHSDIKDRLGLENSEFGFTYTKNIKQYIQVYLAFAQNDKYRQQFEKAYMELVSKVGMASPIFEYKGIDNKLYSLIEFKEKYTYIDIWASWCAPCISQIPHLKLLEEEFKDKVNFVSIAWNDDVSSWKEMIKSKKLDGYQLFAEKKDDDFFSFYDVQKSGIPRFILLDKEGKILNAIAQQPASEDLARQLRNLK